MDGLLATRRRLVYETAFDSTREPVDETGLEKTFHGLFELNIVQAGESGHFVLTYQTTPQSYEDGQHESLVGWQAECLFRGRSHRSSILLRLQMRKHVWSKFFFHFPVTFFHTPFKEGHEQDGIW